MRFFLFTVMLLIAFSCQDEKYLPTDMSVASLNNLSKVKFDTIWSNSVTKALETNIWEGKYIYDSGHFLMLPLHYAFCSQYKKGIQEFSDHFDRFLVNYKEESEINDKARLHYLYLLSEYIALSSRKGIKLKNIPLLTNYLEREINSYWLERNAWHWSFNNFRGMKERLNWKLNGPKRNGEYKFERFIFDDEKFLFVIVADLCNYYHSLNQNPSPVLLEVMDYAYIVYTRKIYDLSDGGWTFQPGIMDDHPDYAYAGYIEKRVYPKPLNAGFQAEDTSHSLRYPLWLKSLEIGFEKIDKSKSEYFKNLHLRLNKHFLNNLLVRPNSGFTFYGTVNFFDGKNGLYAWKNLTVNETGYGPNELSFSVLLGWWSFLQSKKVQEIYLDIDKDWSKAFFGHPNYKRIDPIFVNKYMMTIIVKIACKNDYCFQ